MPSELCCLRPAPVVLRLFPCSLRAVPIWGEGRNSLSAVPPRPTLSSCCLPKEMSPEEHQPCRPPGRRHGEGGEHNSPARHLNLHGPCCLPGALKALVIQDRTSGLNPNIVLHHGGGLWCFRKPCGFDGKSGRGGWLLVQALHHPSKVNSDDMESKHWLSSSADFPSSIPLRLQHGNAAGEKRPDERSFLPCITSNKRNRETEMKYSPGSSRWAFSLCPLANHSRSPAVRLVDFSVQRYKLIERSQTSDLVAAWTF